MRAILQISAPIPEYITSVIKRVTGVSFLKYQNISAKNQENTHFLICFCSSNGGLLKASLQNHTKLTAHKKGRNAHPPRAQQVRSVQVRFIYDRLGDIMKQAHQELFNFRNGTKPQRPNKLYSVTSLKQRDVRWFYLESTSGLVPTFCHPSLLTDPFKRKKYLFLEKATKNNFYKRTCATILKLGAYTFELNSA